MTIYVILSLRASRSLRFKIDRPLVQGLSLIRMERLHTIRVTVGGPLMLPVNVTGRLDFRTGRMEFTGTTNYSIDLKIFHPTAQLRVTLSNYGNAGYGLYFLGSFSASFQSVPFDLTFAVNLRFVASQSGFEITGSGRIDGSIYVPNPFYPNTREKRGFLAHVGIGFGFNNDGFSLDLPSPIPDITVNW